MTASGDDYEVVVSDFSTLGNPRYLDDDQLGSGLFSRARMHLNSDLMSGVNAILCVDMRTGGCYCCFAVCLKFWPWSCCTERHPAQLCLQFPSFE